MKKQININSTNSTNSRKVYDLAAIMRRAWSIRKEAAEEMGCRVSEVVFSLCLKQAWAEAEAVNAEANAVAVVDEWAAMGEAGQVKMMSACIRKAAKNEIRYSIEDHYLQFSEVPAFSCFRAHDFDEFLSETVIRVLDKLGDVDGLTAKNEKRAAQGKRPIRLVSIVYNAARASIAAVYYADSKHGAAYDFDVVNDNGEAESYVETRCGDSSVNTETSAILRAALDDFTASRDEIDRKIIEMVAEQYTERKIAEALEKAGRKISNVAVHKRIAKMRDGLRAAGIA